MERDVCGESRRNRSSKEVVRERGSERKRESGNERERERGEGK